MTPFMREAIEISKDFDNVVFVGAVAVILHTREQRHSEDLDFVVAGQITKEQFLDKGYYVDPHTDEKFTPRRYKIDVYQNRNLNDIPLNYIINTASSIILGKDATVRAISLEGLITSKYRAGRDQDIRDLQQLAFRCSSNIGWNEIQNLSKNQEEFRNIQNTIKLFSNISPD